MNTSTTDKNFAISKKSALLLLAGFGIVVLGFLLMIGGAPESTEVWYPNNDPSQTPHMFSFMRITLAPIIILVGFVFNIYIIIRKQK